MDIKILYAKEKLPINAIDLVTTNPSVLLRLVGSGYLEAKTVFLNGRKIQDFAILSDTVMTIGVPTDQLGRPVRELSVYSDRRLTEMKVAFDFKLMPGQRVVASEQVVQEFVYFLLAEPNTDVYHRSSGGGLLGMLPTTLGPDDGSLVRHACSVAVSNTVKALKARYKELPARRLNEKISKAELISADFYVSTGRVALKINLYMMDGSTLFVQART